MEGDVATQHGTKLGPQAREVGCGGGWRGDGVHVPGGVGGDVNERGERGWSRFGEELGRRWERLSGVLRESGKLLRGEGWCGYGRRTAFGFCLRLQP